VNRDIRSSMHSGLSYTLRGAVTTSYDQGDSRFRHECIGTDCAEVDEFSPTIGLCVHDKPRVCANDLKGVETFPAGTVFVVDLRSSSGKKRGDGRFILGISLHRPMTRSASSIPRQPASERAEKTTTFVQVDDRASRSREDINETIDVDIDKITRV